MALKKDNNSSTIKDIYKKIKSLLPPEPKAVFEYEAKNEEERVKVCCEKNLLKLLINDTEAVSAYRDYYNAVSDYVESEKEQSYTDGFKLGILFGLDISEEKSIARYLSKNLK